MSAFSQFSGGLPVGAVMLAGDGEALQTLSDGSVWLRQGAFAAAASYPRAAALEHLKAISLSASTYSFAGTQATYVASNGAGTIITAATNLSLAISRSTDNGATWADVTPGGLGGGNIQNVWFLNGKFWIAAVVGGNELHLAESVTGAAGTWTTRTVTIAGAGTLTNSTIGLEWTGTNYVVGVGTSSAGLIIHTSPTGVTWTARTFGGAIPGGSVMQIASASTGGLVLAGIGNPGSTYRLSTDHGVTWGSVINAPSTGNGAFFAIGSRFYFVASNGTIWTTTDPTATANWSQLAQPQVGYGSAPGLLGANYAYRTVARDAIYMQTSASGFALRFDTNAAYTVRRTNRPQVLNTTQGHFLVENGFCVTFLGASATSLARAACGWDNFNAVSMGAIASPLAAQNLYTRVA